jgi:hypothetical protein
MPVARNCKLKMMKGLTECFRQDKRNFVHTSGNFWLKGVRSWRELTLQSQRARKLKKPCYSAELLAALETLPENFFGRFVPCTTDNMISSRSEQVSKVH